jgi:hypothetical protein
MEGMACMAIRYLRLLAKIRFDALTPIKRFGQMPESGQGAQRLLWPALGGSERTG